jgi:copper transport protein
LTLVRARRAAAALLLLLLYPAVAAAHQRLLGTSPARDGVVAVVPHEIRLRFYEPVQLVFTTIRLVDADGAPVALGDARVPADSATVLVVPVAGPLRSGRYTVRWATASRDGHPVQGEFGFVIDENAAGLADDHELHRAGEYAGTVPAPGQPSLPPEHHPAETDPGSFRADAAAYVVVRWVSYLAILGVIGTVAFRFLVLGYLRRRGGPADGSWLSEAARRAAAVGLLFGSVLLLAGAARLYAQSLAMHGPQLALDAERLLMMLQRTVWGWAWLVQMTAGSAALVSFALAHRSPASAAAWSGAALAAAALAVTPALSGHAAAMTGAMGTFAIVTHTLHVMSAAGWLGSLFVLLTAGIPAALSAGDGGGAERVSRLVRGFSPIALFFAALLIASGTLATFLHSSSLDALIGSRYGTILLVKLGIFLLVFGTGAYNFLKVQPALGREASTRHLKRSAGIELAIAAAVLLVTAVLVATARPYEEEEEYLAADVTDGATVEDRVPDLPGEGGYGVTQLSR